MTLTTDQPAGVRLANEMEQQKRRLDVLLTVLPLCGHYPVGSLADWCVRCRTHNRADGLSRDLMRLESKR